VRDLEKCTLFFPVARVETTIVFFPKPIRALSIAGRTKFVARRAYGMVHEARRATGDRDGPPHRSWVSSYFHRLARHVFVAKFPPASANSLETPYAFFPGSTSKPGIPPLDRPFVRSRSADAWPTSTMCAPHHRGDVFVLWLFSHRARTVLRGNRSRRSCRTSGIGFPVCRVIAIKRPSRD